ncbi:unnamed protein product [Polarella glacialis]|uniref:Armadillo repeat-containing protein 8 n=1 Tax=Polarella glacialis TaxID=89957 RepID=A0A813H311_POLGL|nr:unnamed protein product [Polarella glacialis]
MSGDPPTRKVVKALCAIISRAEEEDFGPSAVLSLRQLYAWLWTFFATDVQDWLQVCHAHAALVGALSCLGPHGRDVACWSCHIIGRAAHSHPQNALSFAEAGAVPSISDLIQRFPNDSEVHLAAATALTYLAKCNKVQDSMFSTGAIPRLLAAVEEQMTAE